MAKVFDWDSTISNDGNEMEFVLLPDGEYEFTVSKLDKMFYTGNSTKVPENCPMAELTLSFVANGGVSVVKERILLYDAMEWKLSSFFRCIGQKEHGKSLKMDWGKVVGSKGRAKLTSREWTGNDGVTRKSNCIKSFVDSSAPSTSDDMPFEI